MAGVNVGRLLGGMGMLAAFVNFQLGHEDPAQAVFRHHAAHGVGDELLGMAGADLGDGGVFFAAFPAGIGHEFLVRFLFAGEADFLGVDHDDEIAGVEVSGINGFVFPAQNVGDLNRQAAKDGAIGIDNVPLALVQIVFRQIRFHQ